MHTQRYYRRSSRATIWLRLFALGLTMLAGACATPNATARHARRLMFADLDGPDRVSLARHLGEGPSIIHFRKGDRIPVALAIDSPLFELEGAGGVALTVQRDVYLLLHDGPPLLSADGHHFEAAAKNYFMFGFKVMKDEPASLQLKVGLRPEWASAAPAAGGG